MQRIRTLDLARGFTVLLIAPIHSMLVYGSLSLRDHFFTRFLAFIAEWQGAQVFMLAMGLSVSFSSKTRFLPVIKRSMLLLVAAMVLNLFKFVLPYYFHWIPKEMLNELDPQPDSHTPLKLFLIIDILPFAAAANLILWLVQITSKRPLLPFLLALIVCLSAPLFWDLHSSHPYMDFFLQFLGGHPPQVFFPLSSWLVYPLAGMGMGRFIRQWGEYKTLAFAYLPGSLLFLTGLLANDLSNPMNPYGFYRSLPFETMEHLGAILIGISFWNWISRKINDSSVFHLFEYCSGHITRIYLIQWPLICWLLPLFGFQDLNLIPALLAMSFVTLSTLTISIYIHAKQIH